MRLTVSLTWTASTESDLAGYRISWLEKTVTVPKSPTRLHLSVELPLAKHVCFYAQAFDVAGNLSPKRLIHAAYVA